jgi:lipopolysaccharide biosynthesis glycosyltransferase
VIYSVWIGFDPRETAAYAVARQSARWHMTSQAPIRGVVLSDLQARALYRRPLEFRKSAADRPIMWDVISDAPMATQHACARFLIKELAGSGWAMFSDGDVLFRGNVMRLFQTLDRRVPLYCVKHDHVPKETVKMDGQPQTAYPKKNWSSVFILNCDHEANRALTVDLINTVPGRDLHRFCWLDESEIGALGAEWNYLVGQSPQIADPKLVHFTLGVPDMPGYEDCEYADEWRAELRRWAA